MKQPFGMELLNAFAHIPRDPGCEAKERREHAEKFRESPRLRHPDLPDHLGLIHDRLADHDEIRNLKSVQSPGVITELKGAPVKPRVDIEPVIAGVMVFGLEIDLPAPLGPYQSLLSASSSFAPIRNLDFGNLSRGTE